MAVRREIDSQVAAGALGSSHPRGVDQPWRGPVGGSRAGAADLLLAAFVGTVSTLRGTSITQRDEVVRCDYRAKLGGSEGEFRCVGRS